MLIGLSWGYHTITLQKERKETPPPGELVDVNGHKMHVYTEGNGTDTIVFMSGGGTSAPTLDFKPLWSRLAEEHRIAVVEKAGYGWSDVADVSREIDVILEETRTALERAGEKPPYILAPHSMSGIEAIRWAQKYPEEVAAIVGLDPAIPEVYEKMELPGSLFQRAAAFAGNVGLLRLFPAVADSSAVIQSGELTNEEEEAYRAIFYRRTLTSNMQEEVNQIQDNAKRVADAGIPSDIPVYFFISKTEDLGIENWSDMLVDYTEQFEDGRHLLLNVGHYIHVKAPDQIAEEITKFIEEVSQSGADPD